MIGTGVDFYKETKHAEWPPVAATVNWSIVQQATQPRLRSAETERVWYVESQVHYTVDGQEARSSVRSRITSFRETRDEMRAWVSRHGAGTTLPMRYDPKQPADAVLDAAADMPEAGPKTGDDLKMFLVFLLATIVFASAAWLARRGFTSR